MGYSSCLTNGRNVHTTKQEVSKESFYSSSSLHSMLAVITMQAEAQFGSVLAWPPQQSQEFLFSLGNLPSGDFMALMNKRISG